MGDPILTVFIGGRGQELPAASDLSYAGLGALAVVTRPFVWLALTHLTACPPARDASGKSKNGPRRACITITAGAVT